MNVSPRRGFAAFAVAAAFFFAAHVARPASTNTLPSTHGAPSGRSLTVEDWIKRADDARSRGLAKKALEFADQAVAVAPSDPRGYYLRAQLNDRAGFLEAAIIDLTRVLELTPGEPTVLLQRGLSRLRSSEFTGAVADFDLVIADRPSRAPELWQRGIALFYAGRWDDGRRQFELHRNVNPQDVENSAWHFACVARLRGFSAARAALLPVTEDSRVPMTQIQRLLAGTGSAVEVLRAAEGVADPGRRAMALLYAELYLALYFGAEGRVELEAKHAAEAARLGPGNGIMGEIARVHADWVADRMRRAAGK